MNNFFCVGHFSLIVNCHSVWLGFVLGLGAPGALSLGAVLHSRAKFSGLDWWR